MRSSPAGVACLGPLDLGDVDLGRLELPADALHPLQEVRLCLLSELRVAELHRVLQHFFQRERLVGHPSLQKSGMTIGSQPYRGLDQHLDLGRLADLPEQPQPLLGDWWEVFRHVLRHTRRIRPPMVFPPAVRRAQGVLLQVILQRGEIALRVLRGTRSFSFTISCKSPAVFLPIPMFNSFCYFSRLLLLGFGSELLNLSQAGLDRDLGTGLHSSPSDEVGLHRPVQLLHLLDPVGVGPLACSCSPGTPVMARCIPALRLAL